MTRYLTGNSAREIDQHAIQRFGMTGLVLMENAGRGCVDVLQEVGIHGPVLICCGKGNNGGDGFVIGRHLDNRGFEVRILLCAAPGELRGDAFANYEIARRAGLKIDPWDAGFVDFPAQLAASDWCIDALLGTGAKGAPRPPVSQVLDQLSQHANRILSVDLPSGLDCDTGEPAAKTVRATVTCTFVAPKIGFQNERAAAYLGEIRVVDIGIPRKLVDEL